MQQKQVQRLVAGLAVRWFRKFLQRMQRRYPCAVRYAEMTWIEHSGEMFQVGVGTTGAGSEVGIVALEALGAFARCASCRCMRNLRA